MPAAPAVGCERALSAAHLQPPVVVEPTGEHHFSVILLHGFSNRGTDFLPLMRSFARLGIDVSRVRFIFPNAPRRTMHWPGSDWSRRGFAAWYTYYTDLSGQSSADADEIAVCELEASAAALRALAAAEAAALGGDYSRVFVGGYSQGGTVAAHAAVTEGAPRLAGVLLSRSVLMAQTIPSLTAAEGSPTPFFAFRSGRDNVYPIDVQCRSQERLVAGGWTLAALECSDLNHAPWSWTEYDYAAACAAFALGLSGNAPPTGVVAGGGGTCSDLKGMLLSLCRYRFPYQLALAFPCCRGDDQAPATDRKGTSKLDTKS
eukprot:scaffold74050_cov37-Tisochrysis_lutea.AAC.11